MRPRSSNFYWHIALINKSADDINSGNTTLSGAENSLIFKSLIGCLKKFCWWKKDKTKMFYTL